jgi:DNA-binding PadR family transcriptional regulator
LELEDELQKWETEFKKGFSKPFVLFSLAERPNYPYQVTKAVLGQTKGQFSIAGSNIYPILKKLSDDGFISFQIKVDKDGSEKKVYSLTTKGKDFLILLKRTMKEFTGIVQEMIDTHDEL